MQSKCCMLSEFQSLQISLVVNQEEKTHKTAISLQWNLPNILKHINHVAYRSSSSTESLTFQKQFCKITIIISSLFILQKRKLKVKKVK